MRSEALSARANIAEQLRSMRLHERLGMVRVDRDGKGYETIFRGLVETFSYVSGLRSKIVLDVGAGNTRGIAELSRYYPYLDFRATVLTMPRNSETMHYPECIRVTSAESLRGVAAESVGGILALNSIAYSRGPELVVGRLDDVLVPSGVIKATFRSWRVESEELEQLYDLSGFSYHDEFSRELKARGYDVDLWHGPYDIITAVKPPFKKTAKDLSKSDRQIFNSGIDTEIRDLRVVLGGTWTK